MTGGVYVVNKPSGFNKDGLPAASHHSGQTLDYSVVGIIG